eukprot:jgi/Tetstr1/429470/TSEL_019378.t1
MVVQRHLSRAIRLRDLVALAFGFQRAPREIAATKTEHNKLAADRASSSQVHDAHPYYPFVVEDRGRLGKSPLTVVYIFAVLLAAASRSAIPEYAAGVAIVGVAAGAAWAPRIDSPTMSYQSARVRHHPADVVAFAVVADAAYDSPVDEAALTVDMRVPYQQLKEHVVAAGHFGIRNENLRCLVGEYAPASGHAAVRGMSELGVGISAREYSVLIHGVRLIAKKLGPRAVIVHFDFRNAYNEAWRRTSIQRHIIALLYDLSLVEECDNTLEVTEGAARFDTDNGYLLGLPEHVWPDLDAFRTSIKASKGFGVCFDKMHADNAGTETARREAPADIEWPELDGHHGIPVLNAFAEAVDVTALTAAEWVLLVFFHPSTYRTDTNPVVTHFLAELLHDPDPTAAAEATTLREDAVAKARSMLNLLTRLKGGGIRRMATVRESS